VRMSRNRWLGILLIGICALLYARVSAQAPQAQALVIDGGTLIDGNGGTPVPNSVVVIQGNRITAVGRKGAVNVPANARVIDAAGKFVLPGLWDGQTIYNWYYGEMMFKYGVTSNIGIGNSGEIGVAVRDAILHGKLFGPRPFTAISRIVTNNNNNTGLETTLTPNRAPKSAQETRDYVKAYIAAGADMVIFQDGGLPYEYYVAGFEEANKTNTPVFTRSYGPGLDPRRAAMLGSKNLPHSAGIGMSVAKNPPPGGGRGGANELELYADMDDAKARDLIQVLVQHGTALVATLKLSYGGYPKDWARFEREDRQVLTDPNLLAYYPPARVVSGLAAYNNPPVTTALRRQGYQNLLRFLKMFSDAGGRVVPGGDTNASKIPGINIHHEFLAISEAGIPPMRIIQGATKWAAEMINKGKDLGTVEAGKLADVIVLNADPLQSIDNLRQVDTVIFDGRQVELGVHPWFSDPFRRDSGYNPPVENLGWVVAFKQSMFGDNPPGAGRGGAGGGRGGAAAAMTPVLPDPVLSPNPAIESISPIMFTEGTPTSTVTLKGFNFVRRSQVLFKGQSVPYKVVSPTELQVAIDANLLKEAGWFDLVVKNPWPYNPTTGAAWGNGTSNNAHLIINFRY
jgi:Amidohydrolase family/IPT/TIG domain